MSSLQNKMYNYEVPPPKNGWDKIAASLDESLAGNKFPERLYEMEINPPASAWKEINASLEEKQERVIPVRKRTLSFFRYAAAAAFIALAAWGVIRLTNVAGKAENATVSGNAENTITSTPEPTTTEDDNNPVKGVNESATDIGNAISQNKKETRSYATKKAATRYTASELNLPPSATANYDGFMSNDAGNNLLYAYEDHTQDISNRYVMLMTPDGNIIRMSKKWSDLICCVSGEEQDEDCKNQLKQWQKKIATSPISPSSGNFLDLLDLVSSLEESPDL